MMTCVVAEAFLPLNIYQVCLCRISSSILDNQERITVLIICKSLGVVIMAGSTVVGQLFLDKSNMLLSWDMVG
ncbi:hypothetical protein L1987_01126 [Smallanthus sonchifolius]|uniref:Uncharacterized protein n=1 Tax=Smallanthus sonchifolius TaxID=185202 RepID=A0ACB9K484_9ASTR|nr:hypothetical protein L1987_01126 [Smallanthus sonchifolius]